MRLLNFPAAVAFVSLTSLFSTAALQAGPGDLETSFNPNPNGTVIAVATQADGKIVIGGSFNSVSSTSRSRLARLTAAGGLDSFNPNANNQVHAIAMQGENILIGGHFTTVADTSRNRIARLDSSGVVDDAFNPNLDGEVNVIALDAADKIIIGGAFTTVGGVSRPYLARLNADGSLDAGFNAGVAVTSFGAVDTLAVQPDGKIIIGGRFTSVGGEARRSLARVDGDTGAVDPVFAPDPDNYVHSILVQADGRIVIAGNFSVLGTYPSWALRNRMARLNADGSVDETFNPNVTGGAVFSTALQANGQIVISGLFTSVGGTTRNRVARLHADGSLDTDFDPNAGNAVYGVALQADGKVLINGVFTQLGGTHNRVARLENDNASSTLSTPNATTVQWLRAGASPEVSSVTFERSTDSGESWSTLGSGTRISGGWELSGVAWGGGLLRARGQVKSGRYTGSSGIVAQSLPSSVLSVSPPTSGTYKVGDEVNFTINWNEPVNVVGTPSLALTVGSSSRSANYASGSGTATTVFRYVVQSGDLDADGLTIGTLSLNGGTISNTSATDANTTLNSVGSTSGVLVDGVAPRVTSIARQSPASSPTAADTLVFRITFNESVVNVGTNDFAVSGTTATVTNAAAAGGNAYDVTISGGNLANLNATVTLSFVGSPTIADSTGNALTNTTPTGSNENTYIVANNVAPTDIALSPATINESAAAAGATIGTLTTTDTDVGNTHTYALVSGTGDTANEAFALDGATLKIGASALTTDDYSIRLRTTDGAGAFYEKALTITIAGPRATAVHGITDAGTKVGGDNFLVRVSFDESVVVTGAPTLMLETGAIDRVIPYESGSESSTLFFRYAVRPGDTSPDLDYASTAALALNGGTIRDADGNDARLTLPAPGTSGSLGANENIVIAAAVNTAPTDLALSATVIGEPAAVSGATVGTLSTSDADVGDIHAYALVTGSGDSHNSSFVLDGAALKIGAAPLTAGDYSVRIRTTDSSGALAERALTITVAAGVTNVHGIASPDTYDVGDSFLIRVTFSTTVTVTGTPSLTLETGAVDRVATYESGSGNTQLFFRYTVQAGDMSADLDYVSDGALALTGGTILDVNGKAAVLALPAPGEAGSLGANEDLVVNTAAPAVTAVNGITASGTYGAGQSFLIRLTFSKSVFVTGIPQLTLETGAIDRVIPYESGSDSMQLFFRYTVRPGDASADLDYASSAALALNDGTIRDDRENDAVLTLPEPAAAGSLAANEAIAIDAANSAPTDIALSEGTINQSAALAAASVGTLTTTDPDNGVGDEHVYAFASGEGDTHNSSFALEGATLKIDDSALVAGSYSVRIRTTDVAGASLEKNFAISVLDNVAPAAPSAPDLAAASDSGSSNTDNHTRVTTPTFTGTAEVGSTVKLYAGESLIGTGTATGGTWSITSSSLAAGTHSITATATDAANNTSSASVALPTTIETTAPTLVAGAPSASLTRTGPVTFAITYSDSNFAASALALEHLTLNKTGTANGTLALDGSGTSYTVTVSELTGDGTLGISIAAGTATDVAGNEAPAVAATGTFTVDNTAPTLSPVTIASNNATTSLAKAGDTVTVSFAASETIATPAVTMAGRAAAVSNPSGDTWIATQTIAADDPAGVVAFSIAFTDTAGNSGSAVTATTNASSVINDFTAPTLESVTVASNNANPAWAKVGDDVVVSFTASETIATPTVTLAGRAATVEHAGSTTWTATATMQTGDTQAAVAFAIDFADSAGNEGTTVTATTDGSAVGFDETSPTVTVDTASESHTNTGPVTFAVAYADANFDTATLAIDDIALNKTGTADATLTVTGNGNTYTAILSDITGDGTLGVTLAAGTATDFAGNTAPASPASETFTVDNTAPTLPSVTIASNNATTSLAKTGDTVTVSFTASEEISSPTVLIAGRAALVANPSGHNWTATQALLAGDSDGEVSFSIAFADTAGNSGSAVTATTDSSAVTIDSNAPTLTSVSIASNNLATGWAKAGDEVVVTFTASETIAAPTATLAGRAAAVANSSGNTWTATTTMLADDVEGAIAFAVAFADAASNPGVAVSETTDATSVTFDATAPTIALSAPSATSTRTGPITFTVTYADANFDASSLASEDITLSKTGTADATLTVSDGTGTTRTITLSDIAGDGTLTVSLPAGTAGDLAGNMAPAAGPSASVNVDNTAPQIVSSRRHSPATVHSAEDTLVWRVSFDGDVTGVDASDFVLTNFDGDGYGTVGSITAHDPATYDVEVTTVSGPGMLRLDLGGADTGIFDLAGNPAPDATYAQGEFYLVGIENVFDTMILESDATAARTVDPTTGVAQRFTTSSGAPLTLTTIAVPLGAVNAPEPVVRLYEYDADEPATLGTFVAEIESPQSLTANALNIWTSSELLKPNQAYWIVFTTPTGSFELSGIEDLTGGSGAWLGEDDYTYMSGDPGTTIAVSSGAVRLALGATSTPVITSALTGAGTYGTPFNYPITATNVPTSYSATDLPPGLALDSATGAIAGSPTQAGTFDVVLSATNASGTGTPATLVLTIEPASLLVEAVAATRAFGESNPNFSVTFTGFVNGDTSADLDTQPAASTTATAGSPVGNYTITVSGGSSPNYSFTHRDGVLTIIPTSQTIAFAAPDDIILGGTLELSASASSGLPVSFSVVSGPAGLNGNVLATTGVGTVVVRASQSGGTNYNAAPDVDRSFRVTIAPAVINTPEEIPTPPPGGTAELVVTDANPSIEYRWQRNGTDLPAATGPAVTLADVAPTTAGLYSYTASVPGGGEPATSDPVIVGIATTDEIVGAGQQVDEDILHPNGNLYDQVLLQGPAATITAEPERVTRISFVDLSGDIVQVEFSGAGSLTLVVDNASSPLPPQNYLQPDVDYVTGHAGIVITGADETTNVSVFSVGRITAVNQSLFVDTVDYDGVADLAFVAIQSSDGKFGGIRTGNVNYFSNQGFTGVYAPGVEITGPMNIGDINAFDTAQSLLVVGSAPNAHIAGGDLFQPNGQPVKVAGLTQLEFTEGVTSHGAPLPVQPNRGELVEEGVDITDSVTR